MELNKIKFGEILEQIKTRCGISNLSPNEVSGINKDKEFFEPSIQVGSDTSKYKIVPPGCFACNLMHVGRDRVLPIALNRTSKNKVVSPAYTVFKLKNEKQVLKEYFFMLLNSGEKDRFFWFNCDSSIRDGMDWDVFCNLELIIPSIPIQKQFANVYTSLLKKKDNLKREVFSLQKLINTIMADIKSKYNNVSFIEFLEERNERNKKLDVKLMKGVGLKGFIEPNQERDSNSLKRCKKFYKNDFVFAPSSFKNGVIAYNNYYDKAICTEEYIVFYIKDFKKIDPYYLLAFLKRKELGRYIDFMVIDSVRNRFYFEDLKNIDIPLPSLNNQQTLSKIFESYLIKFNLLEKINNTLKDVCPVLIQGSVGR